MSTVVVGGIVEIVSIKLLKMADSKTPLYTPGCGPQFLNSILGVFECGNELLLLFLLGIHCGGVN